VKTEILIAIILCLLVGLSFSATKRRLIFPTEDREYFVHDVGISSATPAAPTSSGTAGDIAYDSVYLYVCTATDTWRRTGLATWSAVADYLLLETGDTLLLESGDKLSVE